MRAVFYPAVLERGEGGAYAIWFPDFPDVVAGAASQDEAMAKAEALLAEAAEALALDGKLLPPPSDLDGFDLPDDCDLVVRFAVRVTPPDLSERVNVYLPKSLIERVDAQAAVMGMSRSSYFGWALTRTLGPRAIVEARLKGR
ncbi:MAG TPA: type II toxin-antitoxin system HicB family antitoxin [Caulobacteraceae bacterium]|nr:type II toxin-antitoxin system HicB family antitoxin [Caulobacteraceae bacterium]